MYAHLVWHTAILHIERSGVHHRQGHPSAASHDRAAAHALLESIVDFGVHMHYEVVNSAVDLISKAEHYLGDAWQPAESYWRLIANECRQLMQAHNPEYGVYSWKTGLLKHNCLKAIYEADQEEKAKPSVPSSLWPMSAPQLITVKGCPHVRRDQPNLSGKFSDFGELLAALQAEEVAPCFQSQPLLAAVYGGRNVSDATLDRAWAATKQIDGASHEQQLGWVEALMAAPQIPSARRACWVAEVRKATKRPTGAWDHFVGLQGVRCTQHEEL
eukprot:TRINITY_DN50830_c0_g2_i2.p1 TRINITY_DN50830_c0_g2~~TRINITY_DN50830_c0_g2_i2.p1  ORF type:complete len:272 (+),score=24.63 TRINITY_DN50830_c0_g2_i2:196-1011(+)